MSTVAIAAADKKELEDLRRDLLAHSDRLPAHLQSELHAAAERGEAFTRGTLLGLAIRHLRASLAPVK
jgi:hypothetical protein